MATMKLDQASAGRTVHLAAGDAAELTLPETRTAGYSWKVISQESSAFGVEDQGFTRADSVGGTGVHRWTITPLKKGSAQLELAYCRSWESDAGKKFGVTISVGASP